MKYSRSQKSIFVVAVLHLVAISSFLFDFSHLLLPLTPVNLLITSFILFINQKDNSAIFMVNATIIIVFSFLIELIGVNTGLFFGEYKYLTSLGPKIFNTPPIIGFNWWIMIIASASFFVKLKMPLILKAFLSTILMLFVDIWIEPISHLVYFWEWPNNIVPLKNYIGWFVTGFALQIIYWQSPFSKYNPVGKAVYFIFLAFFIFLNFYIS